MSAPTTNTPLPFGRRIALALVRRTIQQAARGHVVSGPFSGMRITGATSIPYLLGTHELEIVDFVRRLSAWKPTRVINVGTAEGYFAVGLGRLLPDAEVVGFETTEEGQQRSRELARANGIDGRLTMHGLCTAESLEEALRGTERPLVVIDIEGGEIEVLDPSAAPGLARAMILVETHDLLRPGCSAAVRQRFADTHVIEVATSRTRTVRDFPSDFLPWLPKLAPKLCDDFIAENRGGVQEWFLLTPR